jgi:hypothetical protein
MDLFLRRRAPGRADAVKSLVAARLGLGEADLVTVAELACHDPGCPPLETVVTVHSADGARVSRHIHKPLAEVDEQDIARAFP